MKELKDVAANYAAEKTNELISDAIARAYADGYRDGYKDREGEIPVDLRDNKTEYVDLGLPSGTLWAKDYEIIEKEDAYLPYCKASNYSIPKEAQWEELLENCKWKGDYSSSGLSFYGVYCIGPNGNSIKFRSCGYMIDESLIGNVNYGGGEVYFWINDEEVGNYKKCIHIKGGDERKPSKEIKKEFSGYKLPIRLIKVRQKD